jgi:hypothetical protein
LIHKIGQQAALFNPRMDDWHGHFTVQDGTILDLTSSCRATVRLLNMNAARLVRLRRELLVQGEY